MSGVGPELWALAAAFCFALALVLTPFGLRAAGPLSGACLSIPTSALLFAALSPVMTGPGASLPAVAAFAAIGLVFPAAVTLLTFASNRRLGPGLTGALGNLSPVFALGLAALWLGETPRAGQWAGLGAIALGLGLLFAARAAGASPGRAAALPLAAAFLRGAVQPAAALAMTLWRDPFAAAAIGYAVSAVVVLSAGAATGALGALRGAGRGALWFCAVGIANGLAVVTLYAALASGPVTLVAPIVACHPLLVLVMNRLLGRAGLGPREAAAAAAMVVGAALLLAL